MNFQGIMVATVDSARRSRWLILSSSCLLFSLILSGVCPYDRMTWVMEVAPIFIAFPVLLYTYKRFPLTPLLYAFILIHALILMYGGAYTYARVPLGFWLQEFFDLSRNPYDKIGHFAQGFVPALVAREILIRGKYVTGKKMAVFLFICVALAISAFYELIEWWAALAMGQGADEFLGTQGDPWDTQSDMFFALLGAMTAILAFNKVHNKQISRIKQKKQSTIGHKRTHV
jgi:putative membrane protein